MKVKVKLINGDSIIIVTSKNKEEFKELIQYGNGTEILETEDGGFTLARHVISFLFQG